MKKYTWVRYSILMGIAIALVLSACTLEEDLDTLREQYAHRSINTPKGVTALAQSASSITITWEPIAGAARYIVYRNSSSSGTYTYLSVTTSTSYTDTGLNASTAYYYKVAAEDQAGNNTSRLSAWAGATTWATGTATNTPTDVQASAASATTVTVSWSPVTGAITYYIYRATSLTGNYVQAGTSPNTSYTDVGLTTGATYYYKVSAVTSSGEGPQSAGGVAVTLKTALGTPTNVRASAASASSIALNWDAVSGATKYNVYSSIFSDGPYKWIGSVLTNSGTDTRLLAGTTYYYKVSAENSSGEESYQSNAFSTTTYPMTATPFSAACNTSYWGDLAAGTIHYYKFQTQPGYFYEILWDDVDEQWLFDNNVTSDGGPSYGYTDVAIGVKMEGSTIATVDVTDQDPDYGNNIHFWASPAGGSYIFEVHGYDATSSGRYIFLINELSPEEYANSTN